MAQSAAWWREGLALTVSVNIFATQLQHDHFVARLAELLSGHPDAPRDCLEIEVLETAAFEDIARASAVIRECRKLGAQFALDDFGTGYSSMTYLKRLPASTLKIDRSFVSDMLEDPEDLAIVEGIIHLARAFGRTVVAEGVETPEHGLKLLDLGCDLAQGYGIGIPMPSEQIVDWVAKYVPDQRWLAAKPPVPLVVG